MSKLTVKQKMIHNFPITATHAVSINMGESPLNKVTDSKNPTLCSYPLPIKRMTPP